MGDVAEFIAEDQRRIREHPNGTLVANNPAGFRGFFGPDGLTVVPEGTEVGDGGAAAWRWTYRLARAGRGTQLQAVAEGAPRYEGERVLFDRGRGITESWANRADGLEHGFVLERPPVGSGAIILEGVTEGLDAVAGRGKIVLRDAGGEVLAYQDLRVYDATGRELAAAMEVEGRILRLRIEEEGEYPIRVDPLLTNPSWTADPTDQAGANFARSVSTAGDVNGDGYSDVIIGAPTWNGAAALEGRAYVYHGSPTGLSPGAFPDWIADPADQMGAQFGSSVSTAGDVNADGYSDVIIGAPYWDGAVTDEGRVYVYLGSPTGLSPGISPDWAADPTEQSASWFGSSVSTAGDVNGDGYSDVIAAAIGWDGAASGEGRVYVYHGSATGLSLAPVWAADPTDQGFVQFGLPVSAAGDVNGDGYSDVIIGAPYWDGAAVDEGRAYVYHGSPTGLSPAAFPDWTADPMDQSNTWFGFSLSTAGDVNGDGYSDVVVGASGWDGAVANEGRAYVYLGGAAGLSVAPGWIADPSDQAGAYFGYSVSTAGDVNGDGYSDVILGAHQWDGGATDEGRAYLYQGSSTGLAPAASPTWTADPTDQGAAQFGFVLSCAGDVNGDGFSDVIVGATSWDGVAGNEGRAYLYLGGGAGLVAGGTPNWTADPCNSVYTNFGVSVSSAGDVNGDGYDDVIVGARYWSGAFGTEGRAYVYHGSPAGLSPGDFPDWTADPANQVCEFGFDVSTGGDLNGDGYSDVIIGAPGWSGAAPGEGRAYVYYGSAEGLSPGDSPDWTADPTDQWVAGFGGSVSTAGDVNGDGYSDVIVGVHRWDGGAVDEGRAYVYLGSAGGLGPAPAWTADPTEQDNAWFGMSVSVAGDVNGDGYSDVMIGAIYWDGVALDEGRVYVYHGSAVGLSPATFPDWTADPADQKAGFGGSVSTAGDVNGDGFSDVIVGALIWDGAALSEGRAYVYHGSATGLSPGGAPDWTADPTNQLAAYFGGSVSTAGDVNGDGFSDVIVGAYSWDSILYYDEGRAYLYHGSAAGLAPGAPPNWTADPGDESTAYFGYSVSTAGDVNGDGFSDVILGALEESGAGGADEGRAYVYYGSAGTGLSVRPRQARGNGTAPLQLLGRSSANDVRVRLTARTPMGRTRSRLLWEIKPLGEPFDLTGLGCGAWVDIGTAGVEIDQLIGGLAANSLYHWRARLQYYPHMGYGKWFSIGPNGSNEADFRTGTSNPPGAPTNLTATGTGSSAPSFSAQFNDPGDIGNQYRMQVTTVPGDYSSPMWDSGAQPMAATANGAACPAIPYAGSALASGAVYSWRIKFWDGGGVEGPFSTEASFTANFPVIGLTPASFAFSAFQGGPNPPAQSLTVTNLGAVASTLAFTATEPAGWLTLAPASGALGGGSGQSISVSVDTTGLGVGAYPATITVSDPAAGNNPQSTSVVLTILPPPPTISLSTGALSFGAVQGGPNPTPQTFTVSNAGPAGSTLAYTITEAAPWLALAPTFGSLGSGGSDGIAASVDAAGLAPGTYAATITVSDPAASNNPQTISVTLTVAPPPPAIALSTASLSFSGVQGGANPPAQSFTVTNAGPAASTLSFTVTDNAAWLTVSPSSGALGAGGSAAITAAVDLAGLPAGTYTATIEAADPAATNSPQAVAAMLVVSAPAAPPSIGLSPSNLSFGAQQGAANPASQTLTVSNPGGQPLSVTVADDAAWLLAAPTSGSVPPGGALALAVSVDIAGLAPATYSGTIIVSDPAASNNPQTISVTLTVAPPPPAISPSTASLSFSGIQGGASPSAQSFTVTNAGPAASTLSFTVTDNAAWLTVSPASGALGADGSAAITASVDLAGLPAGTYTATIEVADPAATNSPQAVAAMLVVSAPAAPPSIGLSPSNLSFGAQQGAANPASQTLTVSNPGGEPLNVTVADDAAWLSVAPSSGSLAPGGTLALAVSVDIAGLAPATYSGTITVSDPAASNNPQTAAVTLAVSAPPEVLPTVNTVSPSMALVPSDPTLSITGSNLLAGGATITQVILRRSDQPDLIAASLGGITDTSVSAAFSLPDAAGGWRDVVVVRSDGTTVEKANAVFLRRFRIESVEPSKIGRTGTFDLSIRYSGPGPFESVPLSASLVAPDGVATTASTVASLWTRLDARVTLANAPDGAYDLAVTVDGLQARLDDAVRVLPFTLGDPQVFPPTPSAVLLSDGGVDLAVPISGFDPADPPMFELIAADGSALVATGVAGDPSGGHRILVPRFVWDPRDPTRAGLYDLRVFQGASAELLSQVFSISFLAVHSVGPVPIPNRWDGVEALVKVRGVGFEPGAIVRLVWRENPWTTGGFVGTPATFLAEDVTGTELSFRKSVRLRPGFYDLEVQNPGSVRCALPYVPVGVPCEFELQVFPPSVLRPTWLRSALVRVVNRGDFPLLETPLRITPWNLEIVGAVPSGTPPIAPGKEFAASFIVRAFALGEVAPTDFVNAWSARAGLAVRLGVAPGEAIAAAEEARTAVDEAVGRLEALASQPSPPVERVRSAVAAFAEALRRQAEPLIQSAAASRGEEPTLAGFLATAEGDLAGFSSRLEAIREPLLPAAGSLASASRATRHLHATISASARRDAAAAEESLWEYAGAVSRLTAELATEYPSAETLTALKAHVSRLGALWDARCARETSAPSLITTAYDPNDKVVGNAEGVVKGGEAVSFMVRFENLAPETGPLPAPALKVVIEDALEANFDPSTVEIGPTSHPNALASAAVDAATGTIRWVFEQIDLPPNVNPPEGEGFVLFTVRPREGLPSGTVLTNRATIQFDPEEGTAPISTPSVSVMLDTEPPRLVDAVVLRREGGVVRLRLNAEDDHSGVRSVSILGRHGAGGMLAHFAEAAPDGPAEVELAAGSDVEFLVVAVDRAGNETQPQGMTESTASIPVEAEAAPSTTRKRNPNGCVAAPDGSRPLRFLLLLLGVVLVWGSTRRPAASRSVA